jgi:S-adenosylmethionine:diacylglycerol 3-amino-3-carboxypropyl transferase
MEALASCANWPRESRGGAVRSGSTSTTDDVLYGQVWEDADVMLEALDVRPGDVCLSIASAGDNALALLTRQPSRVIAIDRSEVQLFCLELRVAAYRTLEHHELLALVGSRPSVDRPALYARCCGLLSSRARAFWDARPGAIARGIAGIGRFERYFDLFRRWALPLVHPAPRVASLLEEKPGSARVRYYDETWNTWRWRLLFRLFFSERVMSRLGRRPDCFAHVDGPVARPLLDRTRRALTSLNPPENPYVHWILTGTHGAALPLALRPEHFETIRRNLDRLEWRHTSLDGFLDSAEAATVDRCNLSDLFEYLSLEDYHRALQQLVRVCRPGGRLVYWNLLADRTRPPVLAPRLRPLEILASALHQRDRAFFYRQLVVEEVLGWK